MTDYILPGEQINRDGFAVIDAVYTDIEIMHLLSLLSVTDTSRPAFRKTKDLFAIRQFFREVPDATDIVFNDVLKQLLARLSGDGFFVVKSIYFDKPGDSNWFVPWHQDLTISVNKKVDTAGYGPWTIKHNQYAVQPPLDILQDNFTIRIHLDATDHSNGALRVIPGSHLNGIRRPESIDLKDEIAVVCTVPKGGVMIMNPLLLHASGRTLNHQPRRVIHIEFSRSKLPAGLEWAELMTVSSCS